MIGHSFSSWAGYVFGSLYLVFAFTEMYVTMPLTVCPNCVYYRMKDALCISGLNMVSKKIACLHCAAKYKCPQAGKMGVREL